MQKFKILALAREITTKEIPSGKTWKPSYQVGHHCSSQETYWNTRIEENLKKQKNQEPLMRLIIARLGMLIPYGTLRSLCTTRLECR